MRDIRRQEGRLLRAYLEFGAIYIDDGVSLEDDDTLLTVMAVEGNRCTRIKDRDAVQESSRAVSSCNERNRPYTAATFAGSQLRRSNDG